MNLSARLARMERTVQNRKCPRCFNRGPVYTTFSSPLDDAPDAGGPILPCPECGRPPFEIHVHFSDDPDNRRERP